MHVVEGNHKALINPQVVNMFKGAKRVLGLQNIDTIKLSAFEFRSIQAAKSKSSSCPRKNTLSRVVAYLPSIAGVKVWKVRTDFRLIN